MKAEVTFVSVSDEHFKRQPTIVTPRLSVERFHKLLEEGVFGENVEVSYSQFKSGTVGDGNKVVGLKYTVRANFVSEKAFLAKILDYDIQEDK